MNAHADSTTIVMTEHDAINRKLLARKVSGRTSQIESASRKVRITLCSPEGKRLYLRCFEITQGNFHYITVFARMYVSEQQVDKLENELRSMLDRRLARLNRALVETEAKCARRGIATLASYHVAPLVFEAKVFSMLDRRLLELIEKVDQLMPMLETLCIDEAMTPSQLIIEKSNVKKTVRGSAESARIIRETLERRANSPAAKIAAAPTTTPATSANSLSTVLTAEDATHLHSQSSSGINVV